MPSGVDQIWGCGCLPSPKASPSRNRCIIFSEYHPCFMAVSFSFPNIQVRDGRARIGIVGTATRSGLPRATAARFTVFHPSPQCSFTVMLRAKILHPSLGSSHLGTSTFYNAQPPWFQSELGCQYRQSTYGHSLSIPWFPALLYKQSGQVGLRQSMPHGRIIQCLHMVFTWSASSGGLVLRPVAHHPVSCRTHHFFTASGPPLRSLSHHV